MRPLTWLIGRARGWGSTHPGYWLPLDAARARRSTLVVLVLHGYVKPEFTPDDPDQVVALLRTAGVSVAA